MEPILLLVKVKYFGNDLQLFNTRAKNSEMSIPSPQNPSQLRFHTCHSCPPGSRLTKGTCLCVGSHGETLLVVKRVSKQSICVCGGKFLWGCLWFAVLLSCRVRIGVVFHHSVSKSSGRNHLSIIVRWIGKLETDYFIHPRE